MSFTSSEMAQLTTLLETGDGGLSTAVEFRSRFPGRSLTRCDASDMGSEVPFKQFAAVDLYLVDGRDHCWRITAAPEEATGIVLAQRKGQRP